MKKFFTSLAMLLCCNLLIAQPEIEKGNDCFKNKDYQCAVENFQMVMDKQLYKKEERYLVEYHIAVSYNSLRQYAQAETWYKKAMASKADDRLSNKGLGDVLYNQKKYKEAVAQYNKALNYAVSAEDKDNINKWLANSYFSLNDYAGALAAYSKVQSREANLYNTDYLMGNTFLNQGKYDSAIARYKIAETYYKADDSTIKNNRFNMAKAYRYLGKNEQAMEIYDALLKQDPAYFAAMWEKAVVLFNKKEYNNAITWYKKALPYYSNDSSNYYTLCGNILANYELLNNYAEAANWHLKRKEYGAYMFYDYMKAATLQYAKLKQPAVAEKTCMEAINRYQLEDTKGKAAAKEHYVKLNSIAGKIALEKKDIAKAQQFFDEALRLNKNAYEANAGAGEIAWAAKKDEDIKKYYNNIYKTTYDTLLSSKKEIANVYGRAAYADANINQVQPTAYSTFVEKALFFDSSQKEAVLLWPIILIKGYSYQLTKNRNACLALLDKATKLYAADKEYISDAYNSKAVITDSKDTAAIRKALEQAVNIFPENIRPWDNLLKFYTSYDNAKGVVMTDKLIAVLKKKKDNASLADAYVHKGDFLWRLNKKEEAKKQYTEALVWDPANAAAKDRIKM